MGAGATAAIGGDATCVMCVTSGTSGACRGGAGALPTVERKVGHTWLTSRAHNNS